MDRYYKPLEVLRKAGPAGSVGEVANMPFSITITDFDIMAMRHVIKTLNDIESARIKDEEYGRSDEVMVEGSIKSRVKNKVKFFVPRGRHNIKTLQRGEYVKCLGEYFDTVVDAEDFIRKRDKGE